MMAGLARYAINGATSVLRTSAIFAIRDLGTIDTFGTWILP